MRNPNANHYRTQTPGVCVMIDSCSLVNMHDYTASTSGTQTTIKSNYSIKRPQRKNYQMNTRKMYFTIILRELLDNRKQVKEIWAESGRFNTTS